MQPPTEHFDLIIIGTGSANSIIGAEFDDWSIALVEEGVFGGTCLNRGCIPTKMLVHVADVAEAVRNAHNLGVDAEVTNVRWTDIRNRVFDRIDPIAAGGEDYRTNGSPNVTVFKGHGRFVGPKQVAVGDVVLEGTQVLVAAGGRPMVPDIEGLDSVHFHTSDDIMRIDELPKHLIILGGGFIANELAHVFGSFGSRITIIHRGDVMLRAQDELIASRFTALVQGRPNFDVHLNTQVRHVTQHGDTITVTLHNGVTVAGDKLLIATGRIPNTDTLDVKNAGIDVHSDGRIVVDNMQRTSVPGIWALGDISSDHLLKHVANHEARTVRHNLAHPSGLISSHRDFVPAAVFTKPQIASVGLTEAQAREQGIDVMVKVQNFGDVAYGWAMEDTTSICKLVADRTTRKLVGAHLMGPNSSILIQQLIQGMSLGQTIDELASGQYYIHPSLTEVVENALLGLGEVTTATQH